MDANRRPERCPEGHWWSYVSHTCMPDVDVDIMRDRRELKTQPEHTERDEPLVMYNTEGKCPEGMHYSYYNMGCVPD